MKSQTLTNQTAQEVIEGNSNRFKLISMEEVDVFKQSTRLKVTIQDNKDLNMFYEGMVTVDNTTKKVTNAKTFYELKI